MTTNDELAKKNAELQARREAIQREEARQQWRPHDPSLSQQVDGLQRRILSLRKSGSAPAYDYLTLRAEYEKQANAEVAQAQQEARQRRIQRLLVQADLNSDWCFEKMDCSDPALSHAREVAHYFIHGFEHWAKSGGGGLFIYGDFGTGKSTLAGAVAHELIEKHQKSVIFQQWSSICERVMHKTIADDYERNQYRLALESVDLLVIDEVAVNRGQMTDAQCRYLGELLRRRYNLSKGIILITNQTPASLHAMIGDFAFEAIKAFNLVDIHLTGPSRRAALGDYHG